MYVYVCMYMYIYIYIQDMYVYIYIYIYIYIQDISFTAEGMAPVVTGYHDIGRSDVCYSCCALMSGTSNIPHYPNCVN